MAQLNRFLITGLVIACAGGIPFAMSALGLGTQMAMSDKDTLRAASRSAGPIVVVDRTRKSDRLSEPRVPPRLTTSIAEVEFTLDGGVVLRSAEGATLFGIEPQARRTLVARDVALPQLTIGTPAPARPAATPLAGRRAIDAAREPQAERPNGCDPAFSPIAAPQLAHIFGRCVTSIETPTRLALAH